MNNITNTIEQIANPLNAVTYMPEKIWWVWVDGNNVIQKTLSSLFELTNLDTCGGNDLRCVRIGNVDEQLFTELSKVSSKPYYVGVLDESVQEIHSFKFKAYVTGGSKTEEYYIINDSIHVNFKLLDEYNHSVEYDGPIILKCIGTKSVDTQYTISTDNKTLQLTGDQSREYTMNINDVLNINNKSMRTKQSIRLTCNFVVNNKLYPLFRYLTFGSHA